MKNTKSNYRIWLFYVIVPMLFMPAMAQQQYQPQSGSLHEYRYQARLIITQANKDDDINSLKAQLNLQTEELSARKLEVFLIHKNQLSVWMGENFTVFGGELANQLRNAISGSHTVLIGLDGGIKGQYQECDLTSIFADIDLMPMRQAEMYRR